MTLLTDAARFYTQLFTAHPALLIVCCGALGLCIGSFLNVVALRLPKGQSIVYPPSRCGSCGHRLGILDLFPVFSYVFLKGKCRYCGAGVSAIYPLGEALTGLGFALAAWQIGLVSELLVALLFVALLSVITLTDLLYMLIPNKIVLFGLLAGSLLRLWTHPLPLWQHALGILVGAGTLYAIALLSLWLLNKEGLGGGDIKLFALIGLFLGPKLTLLTLFAAALLGTIIGATALWTGAMKREQPLPFGPFIALGALVCYFWGDAALDGYWSILRHSR